LDEFGFLITGRIRFPGPTNDIAGLHIDERDELGVDSIVAPEIDADGQKLANILRGAPYFVG
jgi:hypothetical protein